MDLKKEMPDKLTLAPNRDGEFRVLFISDFHAPSDRDWDERLPLAVGALLDHTGADLCVNLGDFISDGEMDSADRLLRYVAAIAAPCESRGVPWCHVPGNHDHEEGLPTEVFAAYPHCLSLRGPDSLPGYGTYAVPVMESPDSDVPAFMIWLFDSHRGTSQWAAEYGIPAPYDYTATTWGFDAGGGVYHAQARWFWELDKALEKKYGRKIPGVMGMHIPLQEHSLIPRNTSLTFMTGELEESAGIPAFNPGLFAAAYERGDISAIVSGHDHINSFAGKYMGIELSEDASLGYDVYGSDRIRGGRLITLKAADPMHPDSVHVYLKDCPGAVDFIFREGHDNA